MSAPTNTARPERSVADLHRVPAGQREDPAAIEPGRARGRADVAVVAEEQGLEIVPGERGDHLVLGGLVGQAVEPRGREPGRGVLEVLAPDRERASARQRVRLL